jgi:hypothetical protein
MILAIAEQTGEAGELEEAHEVPQVKRDNISPGGCSEGV